MENLAHTLLGLSFAKAGLERSTPLATTALVISSQLPDVDVLVRIGAGTPAYLEYHRGFTHGFVGVAVLSVGLTIVLVLIDRLFRLRRDLFRRPILASRIFLVSYLGGLGHVFMDFTNSYGVRPLLPFDNRWFYGDLAFVVDPWIWLILGSAVVWMTARDAIRSICWLVVGTLAGLVVALALRTPSPDQVTVPTLTRIIWFVGLGLILVGTVVTRGRARPSVARWAIVILALYYGGLTLAHRNVIKQALQAPPAPEVETVAAWPIPANPAIWQAVARTRDAQFYGKVNLWTKQTEWRETGLLDPSVETALRKSRDADAFLRFSRFCDTKVDERADGFSVLTRDLRFSLSMRAELDRDLNVTSAHVSW